MKIILFLSVIVFFSGCSRLPNSNQQSWISVESPPHRVIVVADEDILTDEFMTKIIRQTKTNRFKEYQFNDTISVGAHGSNSRVYNITDEKSTVLGGTAN